MKSKEFRNNPVFLRNQYVGTGKMNIALIKKQVINTDDLSFISFNDTRSKDNEINKKRGVHFFVDDYRFKGIVDNPGRSLTRLSQYRFLLTPDFSLYADMPLWRQIESVGKNR